ncbi:MAG: hypothetical protein ABIR55_20645 [Burkholderiaceae bacterium]
MLKGLLISVAWCATCTGAWAQAAQPRALEPDNAQPRALEPDNAPTREQRRAELRTMLQAHRQRDVSAQSGDAVTVERHLTQQERAEIRQQLRQQRLDKVKIRP